MTEKNKSIFISLLFMAFGAFVFLQSLSINRMMQNDVGSAFFPKVVAVCIIVTAAFKLVLSLRGAQGETQAFKGDLLGGWLTVLLLAAYVLLFNSVGFILTTAVYLFLQMLILCPRELRKIPLLTVISVVTPLLIYTLFVYAISMPLPKGLFGF